MSSFYNKLSSQIINNEHYVDSCNKLFKAYVAKMAQEPYEIDQNLLKKLSTSIQYFYRSDNRDYLNEGAILLSMLLHVCGDRSPELIAIADDVFSYVGDFPNIKLLKDKFPQLDFRISIFDRAQKEFREDLNTVEDIGHPLTDYQRVLWQDLRSDNDVITSAPTSAGKTHIILNYLMHQLIESEGAFAVVIVPTRALISEVAGKIYELAKNKNCEKSIEICTVPKEGAFNNKTFFVMTQERLYEVLQSGDLYFDYLFVDEAHNISDKSRGVLLHLTLQKMLEDSNPQIIVSMPSASYQNAYDSVFKDVEFIKKTTKHSPVAKIVMSLAFKGKQLHLSRIDNNEYVAIDKNFNKKKLADIVVRLGQGESNIVYQNRTDYCENTARDIATLINENKDDQGLEDAADYVERFIHPEYTLANCLRKGVAFHYGPLPGVIRTMIEDLAREKSVEFIVCTSTLAEGVNLPAKNLFLQNPMFRPFMAPSEQLEKVKLANITGRAGRMLEHFAGNIILVEPDKWKFEYDFNGSEEAVDKIPTYFQILNNDLAGIILALEGNYDYTLDNQYSYYTIANKLLKEFDGNNLHVTMEADELTLNDKEIKLLEKNVREAYEELQLDTFTLEGNPTVGFIQQNKLYEFISQQDNIEEWTLPHPRSPMLYKQLVKICQALSDNGIFLLNKAKNIDHACVIAKKWMIGDSLKSMISEQIVNDVEYGETENTNRSVRDVITIINNDVRFRMSSALRCYHSLLTDIIGSKKLDLQSIKLHSFIEIGGCDDRLVNLINIGLSRETALEIDDMLPKSIELNSVNDLRELHRNNYLETLHTITKKEITNLLM